ncbi:MAG: hypothetical protein NC035_08915 [Bacteroides sp.]|nr:hypothetical protein [Bacteroides sp.]
MNEQKYLLLIEKNAKQVKSDVITILAEEYYNLFQDACKLLNTYKELPNGFQVVFEGNIVKQYTLNTI